MITCRAALVAALASLELSAAEARADEATASSFERGVAKFQAGDLAEAIPLLADAHARDPRDPDAALLLGIAYYKSGDPDDARPLLEQAERDGDADGQASARVFLGLLAEERGDDVRARGYYTLVAHSSTDLGASGRLLLDRSGPERWSAIAIARPGYDSNVALFADSATRGGPGRGNGGVQTGDADVTVVGALTGRPFPDVALVLDDTLSYRQQATMTAYDFLADTLGASYTLAGRDDRASLGYHFDASLLGGARFELGHVFDASYRHLFGELGLGGRYTFADRDYAQMDYAGYTGLYHTGIAELSWGSPTAPTELAGGYVFERDHTNDATLSETGNGGRATLRAKVGGAGELRASLLVVHRVYDAASLGRVDEHVRGDAALFVDLSPTWGLVLGGTAMRNASSDANFTYTKLTIYAGIVVGASS